MEKNKSGWNGVIEKLNLKSAQFVENYDENHYLSSCYIKLYCEFGDIEKNGIWIIFPLFLVSWWIVWIKMLSYLEKSQSIKLKFGMEFARKRSN